MKLQYFVTACLAIFFAATISSCNPENERGSIQSIEYEELQQKLSTDRNMQFIDVRTPEEFNEGSIPLARNMNFQSSRFPNLVAILDRSQPVYLFCQTGNRSARAARMLRDLGFEKVYDYKGGYRDWVHQTQPVPQNKF